MPDLLQDLAELSARVKASSEMVVQAGPFKGMALPVRTAWPGDTTLPKLLGTYEAELQLTIDDFWRQLPDVFINVGCGEGYYAVGISRLLPNCSVYAIDSNPEALDVCREAAALNGVAPRLRYEQAQGDLATLHGLLQNAKRPFLFVDCEGCERNIFLSGGVTPLTKALIIAECHDFMIEGISDQIMRRMGETHECRLICQGNRNPHEIALLKDEPDTLKWLAMTEYRPRTMCWFVGVPRQQPKKA